MPKQWFEMVLILVVTSFIVPVEVTPAQSGGPRGYVIEGAAHCDFGGDAPGDAPTYVQAASAAFWDSCLNGSSEGRACLETGFSEFAGDAATITHK